MSTEPQDRLGIKPILALWDIKMGNEGGESRRSILRDTDSLVFLRRVVDF